MRPYAAGDQLTISQADGTPLGVAAIDAVDGSLVLGTFQPFPAFGQVAEVFRAFDECVEAAALAVLPEVERRIADLGLKVNRTGEAGVGVTDLQIYRDGGFSCRPIVPAVLNGHVGEHSSATPV